MSTVPIYEALHDIKELKRRVLDTQIFRGYSGVARMVGGVAALLGMFIMSLPFYPASTGAHVFGWGVVSALAGTVNLIGLWHWYRKRADEFKGLQEFRPLLDLVAPFFVGGVFTYIFINQQLFDLLPGMWMSLFGLMNIASRHSVPRATFFLGWYYVLAGNVCFYNMFSFLNPLPMGVVFGIGELIGGFVIIRSEKASIL